MVAIPQTVYRVDRSYAWNYGHAPTLPRVRRLPPAPGGRLFDRDINSRARDRRRPAAELQVDRGLRAPRLRRPHLRHRHVRVPARATRCRTSATSRAASRPPSPLRRPHVNGAVTLAVSLGMPSMEPDVWRKDVRRAKDALGTGQVLIVSVAGTLAAGRRCRSAHRRLRALRGVGRRGRRGRRSRSISPCPIRSPSTPQMVFENVPLSAQILYRVRTSIGQPDRREARDVPLAAPAARDGDQAGAVGERLRARARRRCAA